MITQYPNVSDNWSNTLVYFKNDVKYLNQISYFV